MKKTVGIGMAAALLLAALVFGDDYSIPHQFQANDVISADVMNEVLDYIRSGDRSITPEELVGSWTCIQHSQDPDLSIDVVGADGLYYTRTMTVTFSDDGDGTFSWTSTPYSPFVHGSGMLPTQRLSGRYTVVNNVLMGSLDAISGASEVTFWAQMQRVSPTRLILTCTLEVGSQNNVFFNQFDKLNQPPSNPTSLSGNLSGSAANLSWADNSSNETEFEILRKDSITGTYVVVGTAAANATTFQESLSPGSYWYRVRSRNANGVSLGSNVIRFDL